MTLLFVFAECICNKLGTNSSLGDCDKDSGQCPCKSGVTGVRCDQCLPHHWGLASGLGCQPCDCDVQGAKHPQCNEVNF